METFVFLTVLYSESIQEIDIHSAGTWFDMQVVNAVNKPLQIRFTLDGSIQLDESLLVLRLVKYHQQFLTLFLWIISKLPQFSHNLDVDDIFLEQEVDDAGRVNALNNRLA